MEEKSEARQTRDSKSNPVFGPVPSRRLGRSLGINNIPPKTCTYSCTYCQLGRTNRMTVSRSHMMHPLRILQEVQGRIRSLKPGDRQIDYLTFVPQGEPTLDSRLGYSLNRLKTLGVRLAVISNASLIWKKSVRKDLRAADWVSLKVDTVSEETWHVLNRPHGALEFGAILEGILKFSDQFSGTLTTETMLIQDVNTDESQLRDTARFLAEVRPATAYLSVPSRPPAEPSAQIPNTQTLATAYSIFSEVLPWVECLSGYEGNPFSSTGDLERDLLAITAVHPMTGEAVARLMERVGADKRILLRLIEQGILVERKYQGHKFYLRSLRPSS